MVSVVALGQLVGDIVCSYDGRMWADFVEILLVDYTRNDTVSFWKWTTANRT